jgi:hypothetical protein
MGWLEWLRRGSAEDSWARQWKTDWAAAVEHPDATTAAALRARLEAAGADDERYEIEREMLQGLEAVVELSTSFDSHGPEPIATGHRAVGADRCFFSAYRMIPPSRAARCCSPIPAPSSSADRGP